MEMQKNTRRRQAARLNAAEARAEAAAARAEAAAEEDRIHREIWDISAATNLGIDGRMILPGNYRRKKLPTMDEQETGEQDVLE